MSKADDIFWRQFSSVLLALTVFTVVVFFIARAIGGDVFHKMMNSPSLVSERIAPVGKVRVGDPSKTVEAPSPTPRPTMASAPAPAVTGGAADGESVYSGACVACHMAGVAGAPKLGDEAAWESRLAQGEEALVASVVNGKGAMPPKGGNPSLTEEQIRAAVKHMLDAMTAGGGAASGAPEQTGTLEKATETVQAVVSEAATVAATAVAGASATAESAVAGAAEKVESAAAAVAEKVESAATGAVAAMTAAGGSETSAAAGKPGEEVYNQACVACHVAGVAGAPKLGDGDAWGARAGAGIAALVASVVNGKGAMPPKAGHPTLTEADIENAVRYMLEKSGVSAGS